MATPESNQVNKGSAVRRHARPWRELAILTTLLMELSWITLWYRLLLGARAGLGYWQALAILGFMLFSCYGLVQWMNAANLKLWLRRAILAVVILMFFFVGLSTLLDETGAINLLEILNRPISTLRDMYALVPAEFLVLLFVLWVCWRGISRVGSIISSQDVIVSFQIGTLMFLAYGLISRLANLAQEGEWYLFLFAGLLALSSARIAVISYLRGGQRIPFEQRRILGIVGVILVMVSLSALFSELATGSGAEFLTALVTGVLYLLALLISPLMFLVMLALIALGRLVNVGALLQNLLELVNRLQMLIQNLSAHLQQWFNRLNLPFLSRTIELFRVPREVILWTAVLLILVAILLIVRRQVLQAQEENEAEFQMLSDADPALAQLRKALRRGWGAVEESLAQMMRLRTARRMLAAARIRRVYALLMELSASLNNPRPAARTPLEFLPSLENLFPTLKDELGVITAAYLRVRYGELPESRDEIAAVEDAWQRIAGVGEAMLKSLKGKG